MKCLVGTDEAPPAEWVGYTQINELHFIDPEAARPRAVARQLPAGIESLPVPRLTAELLTLREALNLHVVADLKGLAERTGYHGPGHKQELVEALVRYLRDPANLTMELARLSPLELAAIAEAVHSSDGRVDASRFHSKYGSALPSSTGSRLPLFFLGRGQVPADLASRLADLTTAPEAARLAGRRELGELPGVQVRTTEVAGPADLISVLRLCDAGGLRCSDRTRRASQATIAEVAGVLSAGEIYAGTRGPIAAFAWPLLLQAGGLAALTGSKLQLTPRGRTALNQPAPETIRRLWQRWVSHGLLDEFNRIDEIKGQSGRGALTKVGPRRLAVAMGLASAPVGDWVAVDDFFRYLEAEELDPEVTRDPWKLYICERQYGSLGYEGHHPWSLLQGRYVLCLLFEYAATLGLVDVAYVEPEGAREDFQDNWGTDELDCLSRYDGLLHFRLNGLGAYALELAPAYAAIPVGEPTPAPQSLRVQANLEVVAASGLTSADLMLLRVYAEPRGDVVWRLTRDRLMAALEDGRDPAELVTWLESRSGMDLPNAVAVLIKDTVAAAARLRDLGRVRLVECEDPALRTLISRDRRLAGLCQLRGERYLAVPLDKERAFLRELRRLGYPLRPQS